MSQTFCAPPTQSSIVKISILLLPKKVCISLRILDTRKYYLPQFSYSICQKLKPRGMGNWSDLHVDLLRLISRRLTAAIDRLRFSSVCKNWLHLATSEPKYLPCPPPWLMLAENSGTTVRRFVGLTGRVFELDFPEAQRSRCVGSTGLWLVIVTVKGEIQLQNPFTGENSIDLPPLLGFEDYDEYMEDNGLTKIEITDSFVPQKVVISADFISMAIYGSSRKLAFAMGRGPHSNLWITSDHKRGRFYDVAPYNGGKFYGVNARGLVFECDLDDNDNKRMKMRAISYNLFDYEYAPRRYLVEWSGMLLQVLRRIDDIDETDDYQTVGFEIYKLELNTGRWIKLSDLGRHSLFVGVNTCVPVLASELFNLEPNCIYFTDDYDIVVDHIENGRDMGVFNLADGTIKPHYRGVSLSFLSPPIWIVPTSLSQQR